MTLRDFVKVCCFTGKVDVTCISYYKESKEYCSFRTYIYYEVWESDDIFDDYILSLTVKNICFYGDKIIIDVIEWIQTWRVDRVADGTGLENQRR